MASPCLVNGTLECRAQEDSHPYANLPGAFSRHLQSALFPPSIIRRDSITPWGAHIVVAEWALGWSQWCAATSPPEMAAEGCSAVPLEGWGPHAHSRPMMTRRAGSEHPWDTEAAEWLLAALEPGWQGHISSLIWKPLPPWLVLHAANILQGTEIRGWGRDAPTVRWLPYEVWGTRLAVVRLQKAGPTYDDALSRLVGLLGSLLLMNSSDLATTVRRELDDHREVSVGREAVANGILLAFLHHNGGAWHWWDAPMPSVDGHHTYMSAARSSVAQGGMTSWRPCMTMLCSLPTRGTRSGGVRSAEMTGAVSEPACQSAQTPSASAEMTPGSADPTLGPPPPTFRTPASSAGRVTCILRGAARYQQVRAPCR